MANGGVPTEADGLKGAIPKSGSETPMSPHENTAVFRPSPNSGVFRSTPSASSKLADLATDADESKKGEADVWLHVYDLDPYTGWANSALLRGFELGVYHCGVEIYGDEWSFQYFEDAWDDETLSGVLRTTPKLMEGYRYRESVRMGVSPLKRIEVSDVIQRLMCEWTAATYHITQRNCVSFAENLVDNLRIGQEFPAWIKKLCDVSNQSRVVNYVVDSAWGWSKWYMKRQHLQREQQALQPCSETISWWDMLRCSGNSQTTLAHEEVSFDNGNRADAFTVLYEREGYAIVSDADPMVPQLTARDAPPFDPDHKGKRPPFMGDSGIDEPS